MSYCRWSTNDFQCDLYCYEDCSGGWTTHVAGLKRSPDWVKAPDTKDVKTLEIWHQKSYVPIGKPYDGKSFNDPTLEDFKARLLSLREVGYIFPDRVLDLVDEEITDAAKIADDESHEDDWAI